MSEHEEIILALKETSSIFSEAAVECLAALFGAEAVVEDEWQVVERLHGEFDRMITMGMANDQYSSLILVAMNEETLCQLLGEDEIDLEYASSALGEFVNTYCALLSDQAIFSDKFGKQIQAVPLLYTGGCPFLPFLTGIEGYLTLDSHRIYVGYTTRKGN